VVAADAAVAAADAAATETATEILEGLATANNSPWLPQTTSKASVRSVVDGSFFTSRSNLVEANRFSRAGN
jgi:membrane protein involved in colicin uptake